MDGSCFVDNVLYLADSYKLTHHNQYPEGTTSVYSYFESRGGKFPEVCFFGLQYILKRWLVGVVVTHEMIDDAIEFYRLHFTMDVFNEAGWRHIVDKHHGRLPLRIKAVPEGTVVPTKNVLFTIENTDPKVPWLTNWFETLLVQTWYPMTVCTSSRAFKQLIAKYLDATSDSIDGLPFKLHDFGYRGCSSVESAGIGGAAHMVNFVGTDTIAGLRLCRKYYHCEMAGFSIPATEHSTITTWKKSGELAAFRHMLQQYPKGLISVVSDSYDVFHAVSTIWGEQLRDEVIKRGERGCLVIRPDSGDPVTVLVKVLSLLEEKFPVTKNSKGYKILPPYLRVIQGDGINYESTGRILEALKQAGWSTDNVVFGAGGALLQRIDRDTQKCAFKCSHVIVNGEHRDVYKNPATDKGKRSKKGYLTLVRNASGLIETVQEGHGDPREDLLQTVFENGKLLVDWTLDEIRERAEIDLVKMKKKNGLRFDAVAFVKAWKSKSSECIPSATKRSTIREKARDRLCIAMGGDAQERIQVDNYGSAYRYVLNFVGFLCDMYDVSWEMVICRVPPALYSSIRRVSIKEKLKGYKFPELKAEDCEQKYISGWGPGGQKVNTAQNAVQLRHLPTGLVVKVHESRLLPKNIEIAFERLKFALDRHINGENCYEEQYKKLQREKEVKAKKKRELQRNLRKEFEENSKAEQEK